uniref:SET domain-containing protein n=1 Tax=Angiostrongylus cantonensis TaxID=6313 RepID=A0A0K0CWL1_ANGCA
MASFQIPGLDYDSESGRVAKWSSPSPEPEETKPPMDNHMCIDCYSIAMKIVQQPRGNPVPDKYLVVHELTSEELASFGNALKDSDIDHDGDDFIHCDRCNCYYRASCKEHPLFWVKDREPVGMVFGPYQGILIDDASEAEKDGYCWELRGRKLDNFIPDDREQNLLAFQYCGGVYYRVIRPIKMKEELLVWYGKKFGKSLGVFTTLRSLKRPSTPANKNPFIL